MEIDLSIIIVNYNSLHCLPTCLESVERSTIGVSYEVIVVDNGSNDEQVGQLHELKRITRMSMIENGVNKGFGAANNVGAKKAKGKYLLFLNPDTELVDNSLLKFYQFMEECDESIAACGGRLVNRDGSYAVSFGNLPSLFQQFSDIGIRRLYMKYYNRRLSISPPCDFAEPNSVGYISGADLFIRKSVFDQIGGFDEDYFMYYEDTDLCHRLQTSGYQCYLLPSVSIIHTGSASTEPIGSFNYEKYKLLEKSKYLYFRKHHGRLAAISAKALQILSLINHSISTRGVQFKSVIRTTLMS